MENKGEESRQHRMNLRRKKTRDSNEMAAIEDMHDQQEGSSFNSSTPEPNRMNGLKNNGIGSVKRRKLSLNESNGRMVRSLVDLSSSSLNEIVSRSENPYEAASSPNNETDTNEHFDSNTNLPFDANRTVARSLTREFDGQTPVETEEIDYEPSDVHFGRMVTSILHAQPGHQKIELRSELLSILCKYEENSFQSMPGLQDAEFAITRNLSTRRCVILLDRMKLNGRMRYA